ncbi:MAG TPA: IS1 family transposase [Ferruginibacter sp.]|jgi:insertion element IS1 protein InsB|nr:IS1 family transposase [Ferruginibacter sp.]
MQQNTTKCIKRVGNSFNCPPCKGASIKYGKSKGGMQRYKCKMCNKTFVEMYTYKACEKEVTAILSKLLCESVCIRGIARILKIANNTVLSRIRKVASAITKPAISINQLQFEVDELRTYVGEKGNEYWVAYALNTATGQVVDFVVGKRSKRVLNILVNTLLLSNVKQINTDNLNIYQSLIPVSLHKRGAYCINHIERKNLTLRTHLKRLSRKTICFSRSVAMLEACMKIYFFFPATSPD